MIPAAFDYYRANSVDEALRLLGEHEDAKLLAGGHSLLPMMKLRLAMPSLLVDIGRIAELKSVAKTDSGLRIGALATHATLASNPGIAAHAPLIAEAAAQIADPAVRNRGTIGGSIAHADPASDLPAVLVALDATIHIASRDGHRQVAASDFFVGLLETALGEREILMAVEVSTHPQTGSCYLKHEHPASGYAVCGAAAVVRKQGNTVDHARLVLGGVAATPFDVSLDGIVGTAADDESIGRALAGLEIDDALGDLYASDVYRQHLARVLGRRALITARDRASVE